MEGICYTCIIETNAGIEADPFGNRIAGNVFFIFLDRMEETDSMVSAELLALTYGAFISQIVKDNKQIEQLGYEIGISFT